MKTFSRNYYDDTMPTLQQTSMIPLFVLYMHMLCAWNYDTMPTFNFFIVHLKCFNVLWFGPRNTINPGSLLVNYVLTKNTLKRAATWAIGPGSSGPFFSIGASMFIFLVKLITNLWFTQISKNSNFNYSNLKTNGTNRKFIIFVT